MILFRQSMFAMLPMGVGGQLRASFRNQMRQASGSSGLGKLVKKSNLARKISPSERAKSKLIESLGRSKSGMMDHSKALVKSNHAPVERLTRITKGHKVSKINRGGGTPIDTSGWKSLKRPEIPARPPKQAFSKSSLDLRGKLSGKTPRKMTPDDYWRLTDTPLRIGSKSINTSSTGSLVKSYR